MKFAQLVIGPGGCGKSTYCHTIQSHCNTINRICRVINLDPAAERFEYDCVLGKWAERQSATQRADVRDLVKAEEVMEHFEYGPNGALMFAMEYLLKKYDWLEDNFDSFGDDDFLLIDCPGQIELYTHNPVMRDFVKQLETWDYRIVAVYCMDVSFLSDTTKFLAGALSALSTMVLLETPHINVLTKYDLLSETEQEEIDIFLDKSPSELTSELRAALPKRYWELNEAMIGLLEEYSLVSFVILNQDDEESIQQVLYHADHAIQYGENLEPNTNFDIGGQQPDDD